MQFEFPLTVVIEADNPMQAQERLSQFERSIQQQSKQQTSQQSGGSYKGFVEVNAGYGHWADVVKPLKETTGHLPIGIALDERGTPKGLVRGGSSQIEPTTSSKK